MITLVHLAGLGMFMGFLRAHGRAASSTPTNPTGGALQSDFSNVNAESWFFY